MPEKIDENITTRSKADKEAEWDRLAAEMAYLPFEYMGRMVAYYIMTMAQEAEAYHDHSLVMYYKEEPVAIWPLWAMKHAEGWQLLNHGYVKVFPPLIIPSVSDKIVRKITQWCIQKTHALSSEYGLNEWHGSDYIRDETLPLWHRLLMEQGAVASIRHTMMIDLSKPLSEVKSGFRKSFKSLVGKLPEGWRIEVIDSPSEDHIDIFRQFHTQVAGKETRDKASWELHRQICCDGHGFVIFLYHQEMLIGASMYFYTKQEGFYGVGAYERLMFDQPIGHVMQMEAMKQLQERGVTTYRIGDRFYPGDTPAPSQKQIDISFFKEGFGVRHMLIMDYAVPVSSN